MINHINLSIRTIIQGLQIQLVIGLDRYKAHLRTPHAGQDEWTC
jgi:hypothetical protein